jgi:hypothetical protein
MDGRLPIMGVKENKTAERLHTSIHFDHFSRVNFRRSDAILSDTFDIDLKVAEIQNQDFSSYSKKSWDDFQKFTLIIGKSKELLQFEDKSAISLIERLKKFRKKQGVVEIINEWLKNFRCKMKK